MSAIRSFHCLSWLTLAAALLGPGGLLQAGEAGDDEYGPPRPAGKYWIGVGCSHVEPVLRAHLKVAENQGLVIENVYPKSPAEKAGIKKHDVLVKAGDKTVSDITDLADAVQAAEKKELTLALIRAGEKQTIKVTPEERIPAQSTEAWKHFRRGLQDRDVDLIRKLMLLGVPKDWEGARPVPDEKPVSELKLRMFGPAMIYDLKRGELPDGLSVAITQTGKEPAKIVVKQGDKKWEVTEKELDKLPKDIRPHVERMLKPLPGIPWLPQPGGRLKFLEIGPRKPIPPVPAPSRFHTPKQNDVQKRLEELNRRIEALEKRAKGPDA